MRVQRSERLPSPAPEARGESVHDVPPRMPVDAGTAPSHAGGYGTMMALHRAGGNQAVVQLQDAGPPQAEAEVGAETEAETEATPPSDDLIPSLSQGDVPSCGVSSLLSAFMIWDQFEEGQPILHRALVMASIQVPAHAEELADLARRVEAGEHLDEATYQQVSDWLLTALDGSATAEGDERSMSPRNIQQAVELLMSGALAELERTAIQTFEEVWAAAADLASGEILSVSWFLRTGQSHAFLLGRLPDGVPDPWFLADQRHSPALALRAGSASALEAGVRGLGEYRRNPPSIAGSAAAVIRMRPQPSGQRDPTEDAAMQLLWDLYGWN